MSATLAITTWQQRLAGKQEEIRQKYANPQPAGTVVADLEHWHKIATEFSRIGREMSTTPTTPLNIQTADDNVATLAYLRTYIGQLPAQQLVTRPELLSRCAGAMTAPIAWLVQIGTPALQTSAAYGDMVRAATDAPSKALSYALEQLVKGLGLPKWFVPVIATGAVLGLGAWAYFTFLAPVSRSVQLVRRNPRRRRR